MRVRKVVLIGGLLLLTIEVVNMVFEKNVRKKIEYGKLMTQRLDEKRAELNEINAFIKRTALKPKTMNLLYGNSEWAMAYVHDLVNRTLDEVGIVGEVIVGDPQKSSFFPKILNIKEIPVSLQLRPPKEYFKMVRLITKIAEEDFFVDTLILQKGEGNLGEGLTLSLKYFFKEE